jgi:Protein of unknown function (DUF2637)
MTTMGKHSPPLDGTVTANGRQLAPFTLAPLQKLGPVSALPQHDTPDDPGQRRTVDGDTAIRVLAAIVVLAVAAFAAIVSYSHIFELGRHHGQDGTAARLLPLSVDGLIAAASLVMLHAARRKLPVPQLARWMLALGVGATVAANVEYGMPFGWLAAVVSAWPAVAFVGSVEMAVRFVRDARQNTAAVVTPPVTPDVTPARDKPPAAPRRKPVPRKAVPALAKAPGVADVIRDNPGLTNAELAALAGCDVRTVQRHKPKTP